MDETMNHVVPPVIGPAPQRAPQETISTLHEVEARHISRVLEFARGNQRRAARLLGISRWSLARRLRKHGLPTRRVRTACA